MYPWAHHFFAHKKEVHGEDVWVLLFCDNQKVHLDQEVKQSSGQHKVLLCYLPPILTNFIWPIDVGLERLMKDQASVVLWQVNVMTG